MAVDAQTRVRLCLEDAERFLEEAVREFEAGLREGDTVKIRDAAEKAWNAIIQATDALLLSALGKKPSSHWERRRLLRELEQSRPDIEKLGLRDRYSAREKNLHEMVFYDGVIDVDDIRSELQKSRKYLEDIRMRVRA